MTASTGTNDLDLGALLPDLSALVGWIEALLWIVVLAGPILILLFGLMYKFCPPKEANYGVGYRFWWGMSSLEAWKFTQNLAGFVWICLGGALTVIMLIVCFTFPGLELVDMAWRAGVCLIWQVGLLAAACIAIDIVVICKFDKDGFRRNEPIE